MTKTSVKNCPFSLRVSNYTLTSKFPCTMIVQNSKLGISNLFKSSKTSGTVAKKIQLPSDSEIHNVFLVSLLKLVHVHGLVHASQLTSTSANISTYTFNFADNTWQKNGQKTPRDYSSTLSRTRLFSYISYAGVCQWDTQL